MKTISEIKDEVAIKEGFTDWDDYTFFNYTDDGVVELVAKRYAEEAIKECSTRAKTTKSGNSGSWFDATVDEQSISNIIKELK